jgi:hypothetical protein
MLPVHDNRTKIVQNRAQSNSGERVKKTGAQPIDGFLPPVGSTAGQIQALRSELVFFYVTIRHTLDKHTGTFSDDHEPKDRPFPPAARQIALVSPRYFY